MARVDRIPDQGDRPLALGVESRALVELAFAPFEALAAVGQAQRGEVGAAARRRRTAGRQRGVAIRGAVAIRAVDLDRRGDLAVNVAVAVRILREMAIDAMHAGIE